MPPRKVKSLTGFIFPGQGSQYVGMGKEFYETYPAVRGIFKQAQSALKIDVGKLCFEGPEEMLTQTQNAQPLVFTVSIACLEVLKNQNITPDIVAGHSLGEYTALVACGCLGFSDALSLVSKRGQFMQEASRKYPGMMAAIMGLDEEKVNEVIEEAKGFGIVVAANFNCPGQVVISGESWAVERAGEIAKRAGAKKVVVLKVTGAFHSPLMKEAQEKLKSEMEKIKIQAPDMPIIANATANYPEEPLAVKEALVQQITSPVLWEASIKKMLGRGVTTFIEVGPGKVLRDILRRISPESSSLNVEDGQSLKNTLQKLGEDKCF